MEECTVESKILGVMMILIKTGLDVQKLSMLIVRWWVDNGETIFEMRCQDADSFDRLPIGIPLIIAYLCSKSIIVGSKHYDTA